MYLDLPPTLEEVARSTSSVELRRRTKPRREEGEGEVPGGGSPVGRRVRRRARRRVPREGGAAQRFVGVRERRRQGGAGVGGFGVLNPSWEWVGGWR